MVSGGGCGAGRLPGGLKGLPGPYALKGVRCPGLREGRCSAPRCRCRASRGIARCRHRRRQPPHHTARYLLTAHACCCRCFSTPPRRSSWPSSPTSTFKTTWPAGAPSRWPPSCPPPSSSRRCSRRAGGGGVGEPRRRRLHAPSACCTSQPRDESLPAAAKLVVTQPAAAAAPPCLPAPPAAGGAGAAQQCAAGGAAAAGQAGAGDSGAHRQSAGGVVKRTCTGAAAHTPCRRLPLLSFPAPPPVPFLSTRRSFLQPPFYPSSHRRTACHAACPALLPLLYADCCPATA